MHNNINKNWLDLNFLSNLNKSYIEILYENYLINQNSVNIDWRNFFNKLSNINNNNKIFLSSVKNEDINLLKINSIDNISINNLQLKIKKNKISQLINAFRYNGHENANIDPLNLFKKENITTLNPLLYDLNDTDFNEQFNISCFNIGKDITKLNDLYNILKRIYCSSIGAEYMHINNNEEKLWIQNQLESITPINKQFNKKEKINFLSDLTAAEGIERYLGVKFPGAKRFSLEGGDSFILILKNIIYYANQENINEIILGMAHRGRLNVLVNVLGKEPKKIFNEFIGKYENKLSTGDVKYHQGFSSNLKIENNLINLTLAFNPSHLEVVNPVVIGSVRARLDLLNKNYNSVLPITIHGDAAVIGQGIVQEMLNMSQVNGYKVGGTIHIIINNQIGFTTSNINDSRSTKYCSDIMKMIQIPIFHVNADDPEAVVFITKLALNFRNKFKRDVVIDLVCYRRHGHNEADEPNATQPIMYQKIKKHNTSRKIYEEKLIIENIITKEESAKMVNIYRDKLDNGDYIINNIHSIKNNSNTLKLFLSHKYNYDYNTKIKEKDLQRLAKILNTIPSKITMHPRINKIYNDRLKMANGEKLFDWGAAETLSYATLIDKGIQIRLSGEDVSRGTFFHRHVIIHDQINGSTYTPLSNIHKNKKIFNVWDSVLSEAAVLAFEYGYAFTQPKNLTIWEAQFGDFSNTAQIIIDQFISSGEQKWGILCGLVMLLPHGYEGQGPEHSSARLERYLQLCAENNIQVCIPSTPAQIYHLLRYQIIGDVQRPLIIMSPKSLLRHNLATSSLKELASGRFNPVIDEIDLINIQEIKRVILCSGKIYYDLLEQRRKNQQKNIAIIRIERLYPFPYEDLKNILKTYSSVHDFIWCQEEPLNQGAWLYIKYNINKTDYYNLSLKYIGRLASASPAVGYISIHQEQQKILINTALKINNLKDNK